MPTNEKEINNNLFDQLHLLRRIKKVAAANNCQPVIEIIEEEEADIKEKLYQNPALTREEKEKK